MKSSNGKYLISLDIGTTAIKVGLFTVGGELLRIETREQKLIFLQTGRVEQSSEETWQLIAGAVRKIISGYNPRYVTAIAVSVQRGTVVPLDKNGTPLSNLIVWMDNRGLPYVKMLEEKVGLKKYYNTAGHTINYISGVSKVLWHQYEAKDIWEDIAVVGSPQTLFLKWLGCEGLVCDLSSGTYHFPFDIDIKQWSVALAEEIGFPIEKLPELVASVDVVGYLSKKAAEDLGLLPGVALVAGGGDGQCAAAGCGAIIPGLCMINIGTAAGVQAFLSRPRRNPSMVFTCSGHVVPDGWETEGHTQASGAVFRWFRDQFGAIEMAYAKSAKLDSYNLLVKEAMLAPPGASGLLFIPTFNGSTAPINDPLTRGLLLGLSLTHTRNHILRAILEGITLEIRWMLDAMIESGVSVNEIRLVAGGSRNPYWNQIHADILHRLVSTVQNPDAALVGAAMCAAVGVGEYKDLNEAASNFVKIKDTINPQKENFNLYQEAYANYHKANKCLRDSGIYKDLNRRANFR